jgi:hypothetical protein
LVSLSTATRITGVLLIPLYLVEVFHSKKKIDYLWLLIMPLGILAYMLYLKLTFGDPLYFLTSQPVFGAGRVGNDLVAFPQVVYRYIKIFLTTNIFTLSFFNAFLEFISTLIPLAFLIIFFGKMRFSYWIFSISSLLLGTLTGTFSSMPRYALISIVFFLPYLIIKFRKYAWPLVIASVILGSVLLALFVRGYWVA